MNKPALLLAIIIVAISLSSCRTASEKTSDAIREYVPVDQKIFDEIKVMDKEFFDAYNVCDLDKQALIYAEDLEFFHDKGGLMTSKEEIVEGTEKYICGKVTRELVEGTIEVYPINNYGAVEIGFHRFHNNQEPDAESIPSKFIIVWFNENGNWRITKVISLH